MIPSVRFLLLAAFLAAPAAAQDLSAAESDAAFRAGGFSREDGRWSGCGDPGTASYQPATIEIVQDLDGDGQPEAVIFEGSAFCFGMTGMGYTIVSRQANGGWKRITGGPGIPTFLDTRGVDGWPDIEVGGPGFCFPVVRWNGKEYAPDRHQYEGRPCRPGG